jgi:hypothetical protein
MKKINKFTVLKALYFIVVGIAIPHAFFFADTQEAFTRDIFLAFAASAAILIVDYVEKKNMENI